jgi:hypothetical protein
LPAPDLIEKFSVEMNMLARLPADQATSMANRLRDMAAAYRKVIEPVAAPHTRVEMLGRASTALAHFVPDRAAADQAPLPRRGLYVLDSRFRCVEIDFWCETGWLRRSPAERQDGPFFIASPFAGCRHSELQRGRPGHLLTLPR